MKFLLKFIDPSMQEDLLNPQGKVIRYKETYCTSKDEYLEDTVQKYNANNYVLVDKWILSDAWNFQ